MSRAQDGRKHTKSIGRRETFTSKQERLNAKYGPMIVGQLTPEELERLRKQLEKT